MTFDIVFIFTYDDAQNNCNTLILQWLIGIVQDRITDNSSLPNANHERRKFSTVVTLFNQFDIKLIQKAEKV